MSTRPIHVFSAYHSAEGVLIPRMIDRAGSQLFRVMPVRKQDRTTPAAEGYVVRQRSRVLDTMRVLKS